MKDFLQKHTSGIIVAIVSTMIFLYLLQPMLEYVGNIVIQAGSLLSSTYVDEIYTQIAFLEIQDSAFTLLAITFGVLGGITTMMAVFIWFPPKKKNDNISDSSNNTKENLQKKILVTALLASVSLSVIIHVSKDLYQLKVITSFKQHFRILSPYISEQQEEKLLSEWSLMKSSGDYDLIIKKMHNIADENNIVLPDNRLYSLTSI